MKPEPEPPRRIQFSRSSGAARQPPPPPLKTHLCPHPHQHPLVPPFKHPPKWWPPPPVSASARSAPRAAHPSGRSRAHLAQSCVTHAIHHAPLAPLALTIPLNHTCGQYWQRADGSDVCSLSWSAPASAITHHPPITTAYVSPPITTAYASPHCICIASASPTRCLQELQPRCASQRHRRG